MASCMRRPAPASSPTPIRNSSSRNASTRPRLCSAPPRKPSASPAPPEGGSSARLKLIIAIEIPAALGSYLIVVAADSRMIFYRAPGMRMGAALLWVAAAAHALTACAQLAAQDAGKTAAECTRAVKSSAEGQMVYGRLWAFDNSDDVAK